MKTREKMYDKIEIDVKFLDHTRTILTMINRHIAREDYADASFHLGAICSQLDALIDEGEGEENDG
jgi:hypothetical protein